MFKMMAGDKKIKLYLRIRDKETNDKRRGVNGGGKTTVVFI